MSRIDTLTQSHGPDRFNLNPGCARHHAGVRTGIKDHCCCCDPCSYVRRSEATSDPEQRHCCRCSPRWIMAKFTGSGGGCCRNLAVLMHVVVEDINEKAVMGYHGRLGNHDISVYLSSDPVDGYSTDYVQCRWTIVAPTLLPAPYEVEIDHTTVTCLGVPEITITGVALFGDCVGTISLTNFSTVKVPFESGKSQEVVTQGHAVEFPETEGYAPCESLPRYICVSHKWNPGNREAPLPSWTIQWARDFTWDTEFEQYFDYAENVQVIGQWAHQPADPDAPLQKLLLAWDGENHVIIPKLAAGEAYQREVLTDCGCDFKILDVRPVDDPSPPQKPHQPISHDLLGIDYRGGKCGCWTHVCGKRRCVPRYLCGFLFLDDTLYKDLLFTWSPAEKCWIAPASYDTPFDLRICLKQNNKGQCVLAVDFEDFDIEPVVVGDRDIVFGASLQGANSYLTRFFTLNVNTSFDGECQQIFPCNTATPCAADCGSHPDVLYLRLRGWSLAGDTVPPPITGDCELDVVLKYWETIAVVGTGVLVACGYYGTATVTDTVMIDGAPTTSTSQIIVTLSLGNLKIVRRRLGYPMPTGADAEVPLAQVCNPYEGYYFNPLTPLKQCFFGDRNILFNRWEARVTQ